MLNEITAKDWLLLGLGSAVPVLLHLLRVAVVLARQARQTSPLLGTWHAYHWSRINFEPKFRYTRLEFKRGLTGLQVAELDDRNQVTRYRGTIDFQGNHLILTCQGTIHPEKWQARLPVPIPSHDAQMIGIELFEDYAHEIVATIKVCTQRQLSESEAKSLVAKSYEAVQAEACIRVRRPSAV